MCIQALRKCDIGHVDHFIYFYLKLHINVSEAIIPVLMESLFNFTDIELTPSQECDIIQVNAFSYKCIIPHHHDLNLKLA